MLQYAGDLPIRGAIEVLHMRDARHFECATPIPLLTVSFGAKIASADVDSGLERARVRLQDPRTIVCKSRCIPQRSRVTGNVAYVRLQPLHSSCALGELPPDTQISSIYRFLPEASLLETRAGHNSNAPGHFVKTAIMR